MKSSKTERTRAHIIAATAPIFNKKGYAGTSITDLTEATKLTSGSIYGNFANKEEVALAALDYNMACFCGVLHQEVNKHKNIRDRLLGYIKPFHSSANSSFPVGGCPMVNTLTEADDTLEPLRKKAAEGMLSWKQDLVKTIEQGIAEGVFKADTDAGKTAMHIIALCEFGTLMYSATQSVKQTDEVVNMAIDVAKNIMITP
ncbi:MAG: TetR/AcrR family transcriptional regulator [Mucilaginibacter sp.]|nr:TetR/AcrR family transcriptional regulator [Mucilaginibacter sp.]